MPYLYIIASICRDFTKLDEARIGLFQEFVDDFQGAITIVDASPIVTQLAGALRDLPYRKGTSTRRRLATPDATMLASCVYIGETLSFA